MANESIQIFLSGFSVQIRTELFFMKLPEDVLIRLLSNYGDVSVFAMTVSDAELIAIAKYKCVKNASAALLSMQWSSYGLKAKFFEPNVFESQKGNFSVFYKKQIKYILLNKFKDEKRPNFKCETLFFSQTENDNGQSIALMEQTLNNNTDGNECKNEVQSESLKLNIHLEQTEIADDSDIVKDLVHQNNRNLEVTFSSKTDDDDYENNTIFTKNDALKMTPNKHLYDKESFISLDDSSVEPIYLFNQKIEKIHLQNSNPAIGKTAACLIDGIYFKVKIVEINTRKQEMTVHLLDLMNTEKIIPVCFVKYFDQKENRKVDRKQFLEKNVIENNEENAKEQVIEKEEQAEINVIGMNKIWKPSALSSLMTSNISNDKDELKQKIRQKLGFKLHSGKNVSVIVTSNSLIRTGFLSCILDTDADLFRENDYKISDYVKSKELTKFNPKKRNRPCLVRIEDEFYRAIWIGGYADGLKVFDLIDYGYIVKITSNNVFRISSKLMFPCITLRCCMSNSRSGDLEDYEVFQSSRMFPIFEPVTFTELKQDDTMKICYFTI